MTSLHIDTARSWRGGQQQCLLTVLGLRALGHRTILVAHPAGELHRRAAEGLDLVPLAPRTEMDLAAAWRLARVIRGLAPSVVHAHDPHGVAAASLALGFGSEAARPIFVASRRVDFHLKTNAFSRWKYRQVDLFLCASEAIRGMLIADGVPGTRTLTVHEGIDLAHVAAVPTANVRAEFWLPTHVPVVGNIAALVPHKGQRHLIDAAAIVVRHAPEVRFLILGEGELRPALERQIRQLGLDRHVLLPGFRPDALSLLKGLDVFVMSSVTEGLGTSLLDAMACGVTAVATSTGGIPEILTHDRTGLLVPPRSAEALASAILRVLDDGALRDRLAAAATAHVRERFSAERMVRDTLSAYAGLAGTARAGDRGHRAAAD